MIKAIAFDNHIEVRVTSDSHQNNYASELSRFKKDVSHKDRHFNKYKRVWVIRNFQKYNHLYYIKNAIEDRAIQMSIYEVIT